MTRLYQYISLWIFAKNVFSLIDYGETNKSISIDQIREDIINEVRSILGHRFEEFTNEFARKMSMKDEMAKRSVTKTYRPGYGGFPKRLVEYYKYSNCFVTNYNRNQYDIDAAHIFPLSQFQYFEYCDHDKLGDINHARNGLLLCKPIHHDFDAHRVTIRVNFRHESPQFIFEANIRNPSTSELSRLHDNRQIHFPPGKEPSKSLLQRHTEMYDDKKNLTVHY